MRAKSKGSRDTRPPIYNKRWMGPLVALSTASLWDIQHIILLGKPPTEFYQQPKAKTSGRQWEKIQKARVWLPLPGHFQILSEQDREGPQMESRDKATKEGQNNGGTARNVTDDGRRALKTDGGPAKNLEPLWLRNGDKQKVLEKGHEA